MNHCHFINSIDFDLFSYILDFIFENDISSILYLNQSCRDARTFIDNYFSSKRLLTVKK